jgi:hypothetical protein
LCIAILRCAATARYETNDKEVKNVVDGVLLMNGIGENEQLSRAKKTHVVRGAFAARKKGGRLIAVDLALGVGRHLFLLFNRT